MVKVNAPGTDLVYATFLGGSVGTEGGGIAVDAGGAAYVSGLTVSPDFPTTPGAFDTTCDGEDAFVVKDSATSKVGLEILSLEQRSLLNYTNLKGVWQAGRTRTTPEWGDVITSTVPITVTAVVSNTGTVAAQGANITITLPSDLALVTTGYPTETVGLGDIQAGQEVSATWSITKTSLLPPEGGYSWPITLTLEAANADTITATDTITVEKVYDSGYEVSANAYKFRNDPTNANEIGPTDWSKVADRWDVFTRAYWHESIPPYFLAWHLRPIAWEYFWGIYHLVTSGYVCTGLSVSNADRLSNCGDLPDGLACDLYDLPPDLKPALREDVEMYMGRLFTAEVWRGLGLQWWADSYTIAPRDANESTYNTIKQAIVTNTTDRWLLDFFPKMRLNNPLNWCGELTSAHAVVPYMVTERKDNKRIFVYDSNHPYRADSIKDSINDIVISDKPNRQSCFNYLDWKGDVSTNPDKPPDVMLVYPVYLFLKAGYFLTDFWKIFLPFSPVHLAVVDDQGRTTGTADDGSFVAEIPDAAPLLGLDHEAIAAPANEDQHYTAKLRGEDTGTYSYYQFQGDGLYVVKDASVLPTTVDEVNVSAEGDRMTHSTNDASKTYSAIIYRQKPDFTVANTSLAAGEKVTFEISNDLATFKFVNPGGAKTYDLSLEQAGAYSGTVSFNGLQIGANEAHIITVEDWGRLDRTRITLNIDRGNDGTIDENIILQPGYVAFASSQVCDDTIRWSGSGNEVFGSLHSNGSIKIGGSQNKFTGLTEYVTGIKVSGSNNVYTPTQDIVLPLPVEYRIDDYKPGGVAAQAAQSEGHYHYVEGDLVVSKSSQTLDGLYFVTGDVKLSGSTLSGKVTIVAQGRIQISGSNHSFAAYSGDLLLFSGEGYNGQNDCTTAAIKVSGSSMDWKGVVYAPGALIEVSGSSSRFRGRLLGGSIKLSGSNLKIGSFVD